MLARALSTIIDTPVQSMVIVDSKDLYHSLSSRRNPDEQSVRQDMNSMRFYFETVIDVFGQIAGRANPADVGTKLDSPLTESLVLNMATGILQTDLSGCELSRRDRSYG